MRIVAILAMRNERPYLANCLRHLVENGVDYFIIDNESDDGSSDIPFEPRFRQHLVGYRRHPFDGTFDWDGLLRAKEEVAASLDAEWIITQAPDEILHPYTAESLHDAIVRLDRSGYDVVDFNEFVFLPINTAYVADCDGPQPLQWYYFYEPAKRRLMRARRKALGLSGHESGGHRLKGAPFVLAPETFALRHYIFRDQEHALRKYPERQFRPEELSRRWHSNRAGQSAGAFAFPPTTDLEFLADVSDRSLRRDRPWQQHYWVRT